MKNNALFVLLIPVFIASCSSQTMMKTLDLPLEKGTTWIYSYEAYKQSADSDRILKATYQLTESVIEVEAISTYFVAHVKGEFELVSAEAGWPDDLSSQSNEFWYVVSDHQVLQSNQPLDPANIEIDQLILDYDFPLSVTKSWCLTTSNSKDPDKTITGCEFVGRREVTGQATYETSAAKFDDCYDIIDYFNGGNIFQRFCNGAGVVFKKFDHSGTRFGFEQKLVGFSTDSSE
ncbi:MAG TPA: hypothetical protein VFZ43_05920 [Anaerolineales bacterium]